MGKKLAVKIGLLLGLVFVLVAIFAWDLIGDMQHLQYEAKVVEDSNHKSHELHAIEMAVNMNTELVFDFLVSGDSQLFNKFDQHHMNLVESILDFEQNYNDRELSGLLISIQRIKSKGYEIFNLKFAADNMEGPILAEELSREIQQAIQHLSTKHLSLDRQVNNAMQMMEGLRTDMREETIALILVLLLVLMFLTYFIYTQVVLPLVHMRQEVRQVGSGHFDVHCDVTSKDEIGELGSAFNDMGKALQERESKLNSARSLAAHQEKMNAMNVMSAGIAHEVGNPLSSISMSLQVAQQKLKQEAFDGVKENLNIALLEVERVESIIQLVLSFGRPEIVNQMYSFPLEPVVHDAVRLAQMAPENRRINIGVNVSPSVPLIYGSDGMLMQVLLNLIYNAFHACVEGGEVMISVSAEREFIIDVCDTGIGIPNEIRDDIFQPSFTTKGKGQGTGLGLAISKELVDAMHGTLELIGTTVGETCFRIRLPIRDEKVSS